MSPLIELRAVSKSYRSRRHSHDALKKITLAIPKGKCIGLAGESGSGKSTLGKLMLSIEEPTSGSITFQGQQWTQMTNVQKHLLRQKRQMIFQDPFSSLNPRMTVRQIIAEGIEIHRLCNRQERQNRIDLLLNQVGLDASYANRYPHELSGGQRQRIGIARAYAVEPEFIVLDEPLSGLDLYTQKQITTLLLRLKAEKELTYLFISHDLRAIRSIADEVVILYQGRIVEHAATEQLFCNPSHCYTKTLLGACFPRYCMR